MQLLDAVAQVCLEPYPLSQSAGVSRTLNYLGDPALICCLEWLPREHSNGEALPEPTVRDARSALQQKI